MLPFKKYKYSMMTSMQFLQRHREFSVQNILVPYFEMKNELGSLCRISFLKACDDLKCCV